MKIVTRMCTSLDGCVSTADGLPVQLAFPAWDAGALGFYELQERCDAVLMGRTTFEPALGAPHWPWGELAVYVLGSHRCAGSPDHVVFDDDPALDAHDHRRVGGKRETLFPILFGNHLKDTVKFFERLLACRHQCVATRDSGNFRHPGAIFLPIKHDFVVFEAHLSSQLLT